MREPTYMSWLATADQLFPPYDYFNFVNTFHEKGQQHVNRWYSNALKRAISDTEGQRKVMIVIAINEFDRRGNLDTVFGQQHHDYWTGLEHNNHEKRISRRQQRASEVANETACFAFESIVLKVASNSVAVANNSVNDSDGTVPSFNYSGGEFNSND